MARTKKKDQKAIAKRKRNRKKGETPFLSVADIRQFKKTVEEIAKQK